MRSSSLLIAAVLVAALAGGGDAAPKVEKLRIKPAALKVGSVRVDSSTSRIGGMETRRVKRVTALAVDRGGVVTRAKVTYLEITGKEAALSGKSYVIASGDGELEVTPADGTEAGDEALVREDNRSFGKLDSTVAMVKDRDFVVGTAVKVPGPDTLPPDTDVQLTLRAFDAATATFEMTLVMKKDATTMNGKGTLTVDRKTGLERATSMTVDITSKGRVDNASLESQVTLE